MEPTWIVGASAPTSWASVTPKNSVNMIASSWNAVPLRLVIPRPNPTGKTIRTQYAIAQTMGLGISDNS